MHYNVSFIPKLYITDVRNVIHDEFIGVLFNTIKPKAPAMRRGTLLNVIRLLPS